MRGRDLFVLLIRVAGVLLLFAGIAALLSSAAWLISTSSHDAVLMLLPPAVFLVVGLLFVRQAEWVTARFRWAEPEGEWPSDASFTRQDGARLVLHVVRLVAVFLTVSPISTVLLRLLGGPHGLGSMEAWSDVVRLVLFSGIAFWAFRRSCRATSGAST